MKENEEGAGSLRSPGPSALETMLLCIWEWRKDVRLAEEKGKPIAQALFEGKIRGMEKAIQILRSFDGLTKTHGKAECSSAPNPSSGEGPSPPHPHPGEGRP